ncbi:hypothetical protein LWI29_003764 [Acer saccharum]|uniref:Uncharacterized protein n=1 Tax=Acer saccharum TaxID=4024 RepID=A0AA39VFA4_ACESA|nr:hypothetical protein LWI29_003764 [Acer saccharum]
MLRFRPNEKHRKCDLQFLQGFKPSCSCSSSSYNINKYEAGYVLFRFIDSVLLGSNWCFDLSLVLGSVPIYSHR